MTKNTRAPVLWIFVIVLLAMTAVVLIMKTHAYGLLGWDTYPIIVTSRVQSFGDFLGSFTEKLMDGRYAGDFYRPVLNLSFAVDHAIWNLRPFGYQLTNLLLFLACAASLTLLARRLIGSSSIVAPLGTLVFFLLHPTHFEVIPAPARRPELLACLFMTMSLAWQLSPRALSAVRASWKPALLALLAFGSKETALVLPLLSFICVYLYSPQRTASLRLRHAVKALLPHIAALALALAVRFAVLGGMGGHASTQTSGAITRLPEHAARLCKLLLFPQPGVGTESRGWLGWLLLLALLAGGIATLYFARRHAAAGSTGSTNRGHPIRGATLALAWLAVIGVTYAIAGEIEPWYLLLGVGGISLLAGLLAHVLIRAVRFGREPARLIASLSLLILIVLGISQARYSPIVHNYDEWERGTRVGDNFLAEIKSAVESAPNGSVVQAPPVPTRLRPSRQGPRIWGVAILTDYSVQAWAELTMPNRRVRVSRGGSQSPTAAPDEVVVLITQQRIGQ
ncbi:hypothetical protein ACFL6M_06120 [Candidatus Eisenbacteria bacterium]|uniref:Glycosyltransferase RgtA/B/C/D-like domain-containing protein n=1 Tax=Eiseniibacteriota bacterium TaxID=2212470 RepID=A0ABV6YLG1_UNCEI